MPENTKDALSRLIATFPPLFQVQKGMRLCDLLAAIAREFDRIDRELAYGFRSHMVDAADPEPDQMPDDLRKIGALFDIWPEKDETAAGFRRRLRDTIRIYLAGLGTADAVLKMAALTYGFGLSDGDIERPTADNPFVTTGSLTKDLRLRVVDNPPDRQRLKPTPLYPGLIFEVWNHGLFDVIPGIEIRTSAQALMVPLITNLTTGQQLIFNGVIPPETLFTARPDPENDRYIIRIGKAVLESGEVFKGDFFDTALFDQSRFAEPGGLIRLPRGRSVIRFELKAPVFDDARFDVSRFYSEPVGQWDLKHFDRCIFMPEPPLGHISFAWTERKPAAFRLDIPFSLFTDAPEKTRKLRRVISGIKPAGVEAIIGTEKRLASDRFDALDGPVRASIAAPFAENAVMSERFVRATDVRAENMPMESRLKVIRTEGDRLAEPQAMSDTLVFKGAFDATRFETSVFA
ncbi:hypothetical protein DENIS_2306 [Desulfonema ishimotonii]|uniref:Phage tail protein n=1 Tax=Desulfonema ishimotonii TaxID=45657 RepID=A0A401FWK6_9BACT|nr:hypothetical protein [Desulfonema ishimotonii]GBC61346.1 hypothetical protein DENIS_2306 [Desulfonema ishimotonii]